MRVRLERFARRAAGYAARKLHAVAHGQRQDHATGKSPPGESSQHSHLDQALESYRQRRAQSRGDPHAALGLANTLAAKKMYAAAIEVLDDAIQCVSEPDIALLLTKGQIAAHTGDHASALAAIEAALRIDPRNAVALRSMLVLLPDDSQRCDEILRVLCQVEPGNPANWEAMGARAWELDSHASATTIQDSGSNRLARLSDRLAAEESALGTEIDTLERALESIEQESIAWARQGAAQNHMLGLLDSRDTVGRYSHGSYQVRNMSLFAKLHGVRQHYRESPASIPAGMLDRFTMSGRMAFTECVLNGAHELEFRDILEDLDLELSARLLPGVPPEESKALTNLELRSYHSPFGETGRWIHQAISGLDARGKRIGVVGSSGFHFEAWALSQSRQVDAIRLRPIDNRTSAIRTLTYDEVADRSGQYDLIVAPGFVDQHGLGLLGEALDPDGDLAAMAMLRRLLADDGTLVLAVPVGVDRLVFNVARIYGQHRLPVLLSDWHVRGRVGYADSLLEDAGTVRPVFVLQKADDQASSHPEMP